LQEGRENANIDAGLGFIWRISGNTKTRAARELVELGLITVEEDGTRALKATIAPPFYY
jgi:hypothetical protein